LRPGHGRLDPCPHFPSAFTASCGKRDRLPVDQTVEFLCDTAYSFVPAGPGKLVRLGQDEDGRDSERGQPVQEIQVSPGYVSSNVQDDHDPAQGFSLPKVGLHHGAPGRLDAGRNTGEAIPRKVHEVETVRQSEKVDGLSPSGLRSGPGQVASVDEDVEEGGLPHVGAPCKRDFRTVCGRILARLVCALDKRDIHSFLNGIRALLPFWRKPGAGPFSAHRSRRNPSIRSSPSWMFSRELA